MKKEQKTRSLIHTAFKRHGNGIQFLITDVPKVFSFAENLHALGLSIDDATKKAIEKYKVTENK